MTHRSAIDFSYRCGRVEITSSIRDPVPWVRNHGDAMNERRNVSWMLFLCVTTSALTGCDSVDDPSANLQPDAGVLELGPAEVGMWPIVEAGDESAVLVDEFASPALASKAKPAKASHPFEHLSPTDDLLIGWLRWALAQPYHEGSIADTTGEKCALGQQGPVWYLAGTFGGPVVRECDVPAGKKLFFPLVNRWCVFPPEFYESDEQIADVLPDFEEWYDYQHGNTCSLTLRIDGVDVRPDFESLDEDTYIEVIEPFDVDLNPEHWAPDYFDGGIIPTIGDGQYALIKPLPPGDHVIEFGGSICGPYPFETSATYLLHVGN